MGLFGALFAGVAGLGSQSNKIGIVSNNISNVNTVGYKEGAASFDTLVVPGASTGVFSPGGVLGNNRQLVNEQGLIQATTSNTDLAISGGGLFVVNTKPDGTGDTMYTRSGSFTPDSSGNFVNSAGLYLMGMKVTNPQVEPTQRLLTTVNVNQSATGASVATTSLTLAGNFNAAQTPLVGAGEIATLAADTTNSANTPTQILVPTSTNGLQRGDSFTALVQGQATPYTFTYGGFNESRNVTTGAIGDGGYPLVAAGGDTVATGLTVAGTPNTTTSSITGIAAANSGVSATTTGAFSPGTLTYAGVTINVTAGETLTQIASALQSAIGGGATVAAVNTGANNLTLQVTDPLGRNSTFSGTSLAANTPTYTLGAVTSAGGQTTASIDGFASAGDATENGGFETGTLHFGPAGANGVNVTIAPGETLTAIAAALNTALTGRAGDTGSSASVVANGGTFSIQVVDKLDGNTGFSGQAVTPSTPTFNAAVPNTNTATPTATTAAITGINVAAEGGTTDATGTSLFTVGTNALTFGTGANAVSVNITAGETLDDIANDLRTKLQARAGDNASGTPSSVTVTGNPGNYNLTVVDKLATGAGFSGTAVAGNSHSFIVSAATSTPSTSQITINVGADASKYVVGQKAYINGLTSDLTGGNGLATAANINGQDLTVLSVDGSNVTLGLPNGATAGAGTALGGTNITLTNRTYNFEGNMLDASTPSANFLGNAGTTPFAVSALSFSATVAGTAYNFTYAATPNTTNGQFNSLNTLVTAINSSSSGALSASIVNNQLYVSATNPNEAVTFKNGNATGSGSGAVGSTGGYLAGINWVQELDLQNIPASGTGVNRFDSMQSLENTVNQVDPSNIQATLNGNNASINAVDPQKTITFQDSPTNNGQSIIAELGFKGVGGANILGNPPVTMAAGATGTGYTTEALPSVYDPNDPTKNMASGNVTPQFTKDITVYDSLGQSHTITMSAAKLSENKWAVEFSAVPASDVVSKNGATATDGLIASGTITFDGNGAPVLDGINSTMIVNWNPLTNGAIASNITVNAGDTGKTTGITQFAGTSTISQAIQNGSPTGQLTGVTVDTNGFVTASFSNGQTENLYKIPLATVANPDGLESESGNAYKQTLDSGEVTLSYAGVNGTGTITASALEQSNVDLSTQLTDLIVAQQAYGANTRVLTVTSQLLQELNQIIQ